MKTINQLNKKVTIVMIAHRESTLDNFDRIIKIEDGKLFINKFANFDVVNFL